MIIAVCCWIEKYAKRKFLMSPQWKITVRRPEFTHDVCDEKINWTNVQGRNNVNDRHRL